MTEIASWIQIGVAIIAILLVTSKGGEIKNWLQGQAERVTDNPTVNKGKEAASGFMNWTSSSTSINSNDKSFSLPNWLVLLGIIIFLVIVFKR